LDKNWSLGVPGLYSGCYNDQGNRVFTPLTCRSDTCISLDRYNLYFREFQSILIGQNKCNAGIWLVSLVIQPCRIFYIVVSLCSFPCRNFIICHPPDSSQDVSGWVLISKSKVKGRQGINAEMNPSVLVALMLFWTRMIFLARKVTCATSIPWLYNFRLPCELWCLIANPQGNCNGVLIHRWPLLNLFDIFLLCCAVSMISDVNTLSFLYVKLNSRSIQYRKNPGVCFH
jgi:hypothetical protein